MDQRTDRGLEFVLDNRKLIIGFFVLIAVCGAFFVIGFVEGKRQVVGMEAKVTPAAASEAPQQSGAAAVPAAAAPAKPPEDHAVKDQLDWYKRVNKPGEATKGIEPAPEPVKTVVQTAPAAAASRPPAKETEPVKKEKEKPAPAKAAVQKTTYSVQVGAFRQRQEAETRAATLKSKGYESVIEAPVPPNSLFLLKVGKFNSRADAVATQLKLKKDGVGSFIKTNP